MTTAVKPKPPKLSIPKGCALREHIKAMVARDPLVIQDRRVLWEKWRKQYES